MDHEKSPGAALLRLLHLLWLLPLSWTALQVPTSGWRNDLQNHTFQHTMFCQNGTPSVGLSETYDGDQLFSFDFSRNTRVPRLPEFADWAQKSGDNSTILFDERFCQDMMQKIGPRFEGQIPVSREQIMTTLLRLLLGLSLGCTGAGGFVAHVESTCLLDDNGTARDFTYCISFNKDLLTCWDPNEHQMAPCEFGALHGLATSLSIYLNTHRVLIQRLSQGLQDCTTHTQPFWGSLTHRTRPPSVQVAKTTPFNTREPVMLACYVWGFYPADVTITWWKNGQLVLPHSSAQKIAQPNGDWTYQTLSHLATNPSFWDTYTCVVEHVGAAEPIRQDWTPGLSRQQIVKVSVAAVTLVLGFIILSLGFLSCQRAGSSGYTSLPGANYPEAGRHIS
uniref:Ig-like domain-containing protein n=1 Tax=Rhinolophus ferrumequinum TaxID=59479 RepID=A0A671F176_RHIFE